MRALLARSFAGIGKPLSAIFVSLVAAWLLILILARIFKERLIFFPNYPGRMAGEWNPRHLLFEDVWFETADGFKLHSWWIPNQEAKFTFLAFHGNAGNIADRADVYGFLQRLPANVLAVEYRGYGKSEGAPSEKGVYRDAEAGYQYLTVKKGIAPETIICFGQSVGTVVATRLAAERKVGGVVLEAPFPSASAVARDKLWFIPGSGLMAHSLLDTQPNLARISVPILIVHCTQDPVIPPKFPEEVFQEARPPKFILRVEGYCHEEASLAAPEKYRAALLEFLHTIDSGSRQQ
jgi:fermentation-respiration switch protein FrsA (DUF1100 family)